MASLSVSLGPKIPVGIPRRTYPYTCNLAPSYIPAPYLEDPQVKIDLLQDDLKNHIEHRIQLFLSQLLLVYNTKLQFDSYFQAEIQIGKMDDTSGPPYVGAHSSTLPTLRLKSETFSDSTVSFAKDTYFYYTWNTTIYLPEMANHIDSAIDKSGLRETATRLLNDTAAGQLTPEKGLQIFVKHLIGALKNVKYEGEKETIRTLYLRAAEIYQENLEDGYPVLQKFCHKPLVTKLGPDFYREIQAEMHAQLVREDDEERTTPLPADFDFKTLETFFQQQNAGYSAARNGYIKICKEAAKVKTAASAYLHSLHPLSPKEKIAKMRQIETSAFARAVLDTIEKERGVKKPLYPNYIFWPTLLEIGRTLMTHSTASTAEEKEKWLKTLKQKITSGSPTSDNHAETVSTVVKVQEAAKVFFKEVIQTNGAVLGAIDRVKTKRTIGKAGLSEKGLAFFASVNEAIGKDAQKMPYILYKVLYNVNETE
jgi:hypothetical protein